MHVTQKLEPASDPDVATVILDIDVFKDCQFEVSDDAIWSEFEAMRGLKNLIFFESVTEQTLELFQ